MLELMYKLMEYRSHEIRHRLEKVGRAASMLHMDVLLLIYHFARFGPGNILEIGPYIGGSPIPPAFCAPHPPLPQKKPRNRPAGAFKNTPLTIPQNYQD